MTSDENAAAALQIQAILSDPPESAELRREIFATVRAGYWALKIEDRRAIIDMARRRLVVSA